MIRQAPPLTDVSAEVFVRERFSLRRGIHRYWTCYLFILPNLLGIVIFLAFPLLYSLYVSLTHWDILGTPRFVGLANYDELLTRDPMFWTSLRVTVTYVLLTVPSGLVVSLVLALIMNQKLRGIAVVRTAIFAPVVTSLVAVAIVWLWLLNTDLGLFNTALSLVGLPRLGWLTDENLALPSLALVSIWRGMGYNAVILLAGLQGVPRLLYEAASIDGAGSWSKFCHVTLPLLAPAIVFVVVTSVLASFQVFDIPFVMTGGGPGTATYVYNFYFFHRTFDLFQMGYGSAMAYVLFAILFVVTIAQLRLTRDVAGAAFELS